MPIQKTSYVRGDGGICQDEGLRLAMREREGIEKDDDIHQDEHGVYDRVSAVRIQVFEGDEHSAVSLGSSFRQSVVA